MSVGKASIKRAASAGTKKTEASAAKAVQTQSAVLCPENTEEILVKFMTGETPEEKQKQSVLSGRAVRLNEEMPDYLL